MHVHHDTVYCCCEPLSSFQSRQVSLIVQSTVAVHLFLPFKADRSPSLYSLQLLCTSFFLSKQTGLPHCTVYSCCAPLSSFQTESKHTGLLTVQSTVNIAVTVYCCCAPLSSFQSRQVSLFLPFKVDRSPSFFPFKADRSPSSSLQSKQVSLIIQSTVDIAVHLFLPFKADRYSSFFLSKQTGLPLSSFQSRQVSGLPLSFFQSTGLRSPSFFVSKQTGLRSPSFFLSKQTGLRSPSFFLSKTGLRSPSFFLSKKTGLRSPSFFLSKKTGFPLSSFQSRQVSLFLPSKADRSPSLYSQLLLCTSFFLSKQTGLPHCTVKCCCAPLSSFQSRQVSGLPLSSFQRRQVSLYLLFKADRSPSFFLPKQTGLPHCTVNCCCAPLSSFQSRQVSLTVQSSVAVHLFLPFKADRSPSLYSQVLLCTSFFLSKQTGLPLSSFQSRQVSLTVQSSVAVHLFLPFKADRSPSFFLSKQTGLPHCTVNCCCAPLSSFQSRQVSFIVQSTVAVHLFLPFKADRSVLKTTVLR